MTNTEPLDLDAIEARVQRLPKNPWDFNKEFDISKDDIEFWGHAREDVPALIAEVRWLREERRTAFEEAANAVRMYTPVLVDGGTIYVPRAAVVADIQRIATTPEGTR